MRSPVSPPLVLVVDDDGGLRAALRGMLRRRGYRVVTAADGAEALDLAMDQGDTLAAVVSDVDMPRMDGEALRFALSTLLPDLPVLLMSGGAGRGAAPGLLRKPFPSHALLDWLESRLGPAPERLSKAG